MGSRWLKSFGCEALLLLKDLQMQLTTSCSGSRVSSRVECDAPRSDEVGYRV